MTDQIKGQRVSIEFDARNPGKDVFKEVDLRAKRLMSRDANLSYQGAVKAVFTEDEALHVEYLDSVPPVHLKREGA